MEKDKSLEAAQQRDGSTRKDEQSATQEAPAPAAAPDAMPEYPVLQPSTNVLKEDYDTLRAYASRLRAKLEAAEKDATVLRIERNHRAACLEHCIKHLSHIHGLLLPDRVKLPDGREFEFSNKRIEREMLRGLTTAIKAIPSVIDAARRGGEGGR